DEHNQSFDTVKGTLTDGSGKKHDIEISDQPLLVEGLAPGRVTLSLQKKPWLKQAQARTPNQADDDPVQQWLDDNPTGHEASERQLQNATMGDLISKGKTQNTLPERHRAGQAGTLKLATDNSYVMKIQGANYITLRLGMFFDGTANNTYSADWGKQQLEKYYKNWKAFDSQTRDEISKKIHIPAKLLPASELTDICFQLPKSMIKADCGSACNERTNVQKLFDLYQNDYVQKTQVVNYPLYITGIGTGNETAIAPADESEKVGMGLGKGKYGVDAKALHGIDNIAKMLKQIYEAAEEKLSDGEYVDGFHRIEIDAFGFSRGAAAARSFINYVLDGKFGEFSVRLRRALKRDKIYLCSAFDVADNQYCQVMFAGLFDTVAATGLPHNNKNLPGRLWLDPKRVQKVVHLTANPTTEYRYNFCLNQVNPAGHFEEHVLPGAHSDLGGGYFATASFEQNDPIYENQLVAEFSDITEYGVRQKLKEMQQTKETMGWPKSGFEQVISYDGSSSYLFGHYIGRLYCRRVVVDNISPDDYLLPVYENQLVAELSDITEYGVRQKLEEKQRAEEALGWPRSGFKQVTSYEDSNSIFGGHHIGKLYCRRVVNGYLSRVYLRLMYGLAEYHGVPVKDVDEIKWDAPLYRIPMEYSSLENPAIAPLPLGTMGEQVLAVAREGKVLAALKSHQTLNHLMALNLIHHSSAVGIANKPNFDKTRNQYYRVVYPCAKEINLKIETDKLYREHPELAGKEYYHGP
ncbi:hypothetical protein, partial [Vibrio aerogenes]